MVGKALITVLACAVMSTGCQNKSSEKAPPSSSDPVPRQVSGVRRASASRSDYVQRTRKAREAAKASLSERRSETTTSTTAPGTILYQGPRDQLPQNLLKSGDYSVEIHKNRPGEVTVQKRS